MNLTPKQISDLIFAVDSTVDRLGKVAERQEGAGIDASSVRQDQRDLLEARAALVAGQEAGA